MRFQEKYKDFFRELDDDYFDQELFVPSVGDSSADFVLIGEAPGANEVEEKEPFVGRAGKRLDEILHRIGVEREDLYITNLVKVRPPENRDPKKDEIEAWSPLLEKELEKVRPEVVITLGNFASREILNVSEGISRIHGEFFQRNGWRVMPVYHPAATLYDRSKGPELEEDLRKAFNKKDSGQQTLDL